MGATGYGWSDVTKPLSMMGYAGTWAVPNTVSAGARGHERPNTSSHALPPMVGAQHKFVQNSGFALRGSQDQQEPEAGLGDRQVDRAVARGRCGSGPPSAGALPALEGQRHGGSGGRPIPMLAKVGAAAGEGPAGLGYIPAGAIETVEGAIVSNFFAAVAGTKTIDQALKEMQTTANNALMQNR